MRTHFVEGLFEDESGADATEYALVISLVALAIVAGAIALGGSLSEAYTGLTNRFNAAVAAF